MKRVIVALLLIAAVLAGCAKAVPKAVTSETEHDFGDLPVMTDMSQARIKTFVIRNEGTADLQLSDVEIQTLEGCCPPQVALGAAVLKPGQSTTLVFPYFMGPGMGGKHHFVVNVKTNDPERPQLQFHIYANSLEDEAAK